MGSSHSPRPTDSTAAPGSVNHRSVSGCIDVEVHRRGAMPRSRHPPDELDRRCCVRYPNACAHASTDRGWVRFGESWSTTKPPLAATPAERPAAASFRPCRGRGSSSRMPAPRCARASCRCISSPQSRRSAGRHLNGGCAFMSQLSAAKTARRACACAGRFAAPFGSARGGRRAVVSPVLIAVLIRMFGGWDGETMHQGR